MKVTFPREKRKISGKDCDHLYVVICKFDNAWGIANFWNLPYTSHSYLTAKDFQKKIDKAAKRYSWPPNSTAIMHIKF